MRQIDTEITEVAANPTHFHFEVERSRLQNDSMAALRIIVFDAILCDDQRCSNELIDFIVLQEILKVVEANGRQNYVGQTKVEAPVRQPPQPIQLRQTRKRSH